MSHLDKDENEEWHSSSGFMKKLETYPKEQNNKDGQFVLLVKQQKKKSRCWDSKPMMKNIHNA